MGKPHPARSAVLVLIQLRCPAAAFPVTRVTVLWYRQFFAALGYYGVVLSTIVFFLVLIVPFIIYLVNAGMAARENRGIAAGIPKPKQAKAPRAPRKPRETRVRARRANYCGRGFTHFALALVGSSDACRYCTYIQEVPPPTPPAGDDTGPDPEAVVREAQEIIDRLNK